MLAQESDFSFLSSPASSYGLKLDKYYVLNRLTSPTTLDPILALFEEFGIPQDRVLTIPFDWSEYARRKLRWDEGVAGHDNLWAIGGASTAPPPSLPAASDKSAELLDDAERKEKQAKWETMTKLRAMEYTLHDKNLYAINNVRASPKPLNCKTCFCTMLMWSVSVRKNGGRNFALEHGRSLPHARWILPLDGNCFFTPAAMVSVFQSLSTQGEGSSAKRYVIIPMARLLDNEAILPENTPLLDPASPLDPMDLVLDQPDAPEEPQIGFRWNADAAYQAEMRYGRRSKLELLWRLGAIPFSRNLHLKRLPWEITDRLFVTPSMYGSLVRSTQKQLQTATGVSDGDFVRAGWVHRLFSGERTMEENTPAAQQLRKMNRMKGIVSYLENLDERLVRGQEGCDEPGLCGFNKDKLWHWDVHRLSALRKAARAPEAEPSIDIQAIKERAIPLYHTVQQQLQSRSVQQWDQVDPQTVSTDTLQLALAGWLFSNMTFVTTAAELVNARFIARSSAAGKSITAIQTNHSSVLSPRQEEGSGYAFPLSSHSHQALWERGHSSDALDMRYDPLSFDPTLLLDALRLLSPSYQPALPLTHALPPSHLRALFSHHLRTLLLSPAGIELSKHPASLAEGVAYDTKVASLAAYLDDARLLSRVLQRHQMRLLDAENGMTRELDPLKPEVKNALESLKAMYAGITNLGVPFDGRVEATLGV